jgi:hypothetical protein
MATMSEAVERQDFADLNSIASTVLAVSLKSADEGIPTDANVSLCRS